MRCLTDAHSLSALDPTAQENTYTRVYLFSTLESCVLIGMTVFQIFYMKKWFNTRKTGGV